METLADPRAAARWCAREREQGRRIGFVPTMGAIHEGHLELVRRSVRDTDVTCVSIFVNPLQFDNPEDLARYPRDLDADLALLERAGCHMAFTGTLEQFFPGIGDPGAVPREDAGPGAAGLEGRQRPGHFAGVATIVRRLFELVRPDCAYFGEKDFQQTLVVRHVAAGLGYPEIVVCPTVRDSAGLAWSSRNVRLSAAERRCALAIPRALTAAREAWRRGERDAGRLSGIMHEVLDGSGLEVEYAEVRDPEHWQAEVSTGRLRRAQGLVAARAGETRLIDSMRLDR